MSTMSVRPLKKMKMTTTATTEIIIRKPKIKTFNKIFTCYLCQGYLIDPTTIDVCLHTYCRSCIVQYLRKKSCCPQCDDTVTGANPLTFENLKLDNVLRAIIFKLIPGLYKREQERIIKFWSSPLHKQIITTSLYNIDDEFFSPNDLISLSLEYHPLLAKQCRWHDSILPLTRYLQCPANVRVLHLKRFLCSKYNVDVKSRKLELDVMYEEEILPNNFTLMDVAYCYEWKRHDPMKFTYRILIRTDLARTAARGSLKNRNSSQTLTHQNIPFTSSSSSSQLVAKTKETTTSKKVSFNNEPTPPSRAKLECDGVTAPLPLSHINKCKNINETCVQSAESENVLEAKVKNTTKCATNSKVSSVAFLANDFKSLRSNHIKYSNCTSTHNPNRVIKAKGVKATDSKRFPSIQTKDAPTKSTYDFEDDLIMPETMKKGGNVVAPEMVATNAIKVRTKNVPKLKIELNNLKTKLIEKPKSADVRLDALYESRPNKFRKISLDDYTPTIADRIDLKTYARNIGLKPIEIQTNTDHHGVNNDDKYTPNASPMSSSSSTTSSSNSNLNIPSSMDITAAAVAVAAPTATYHKKRKKKHSKESKDKEAGCNKRKKMHAEISSNSAEECLKMKVKFTQPHNTKCHKQHDNKKSHKLFSPELERLSTNLQQMPLDNAKKVGDTTTTTTTTTIQNLQLFPASAFVMERSKKQCKDYEFKEDPNISSSLPIRNMANTNDPKLPSSSPLPPSLFKTAPLTFTTFSTSTSHPPSTADSQTLPIKLHQMPSKPLRASIVKTTNIVPVKTNSGACKKTPYFAIPHPPRTYIRSGHTAKLSATPTSIASEANKQLGHLLKRSISLDESSIRRISNVATVNNGGHMRAYQSGALQNRYETKPSETVPQKISSYIPTYSPLSTAYSQTRSYVINSDNKMTPLLPSQITPAHIIPSSSSKSAMQTAKAKEENGNVMRSTSSPSNNTNTITTSFNTLMGPPLPVPRLIRKSSLTGLNIIPTAAKSPPLGSVLSLNAAKTTTTMTPTDSKNTLTFLSPYGLNFCNNVPSTSTSSSSKGAGTSHYNNNTRNEANSVDNNSEVGDKPKSNLRDFRLPSRTTHSDILDLTATKKFSVNKNGSCLPGLMKTVTTTTTTIANTAGGSLEMALKKIKQNISSSSSSSSTTEKAMTDNRSSNGNSPFNKITISVSSPNREDLLNLQMLSESAIARERIIIPTITTLPPPQTVSAAAAAAVSSASFMYEKVKSAQNSLVRQQNASVRNIPNPSALAFRNQQPIMVPLVTIPAALRESNGNYYVASPTATANNKNKSIVPLSSSSLITKTSSTTTTISAPTTTTSGMRTAAITQNKKHASIDEVAATLNMRAAAAEALCKATSSTGEKLESCSTNEKSIATHSTATMEKMDELMSKKAKQPVSNAQNASTKEADQSLYESASKKLDIVENKRSFGLPTSSTTTSLSTLSTTVKTEDPINVVCSIPSRNAADAAASSFAGPSKLASLTITTTTQ